MRRGRAHAAGSCSRIPCVLVRGNVLRPCFQPRALPAPRAQAARCLRSTGRNLGASTMHIYVSPTCMLLILSATLNVILLCVSMVDTNSNDGRNLQETTPMGKRGKRNRQYHDSSGACNSQEALALQEIQSRAVAQYEGPSGQAYWSWQSKRVELGGKITALLFAPYFTPNVRAAADIGCGSGTVIKELPASEKWCVEVNPLARAYSKQTTPSLKTVAQIAELPDNHFDLLMSNHALEHTPCPLLSASTLLPKLKPGGILVITVPSLEDEETIGRERINKFGHEYIASDQHHHLYVWGPQQLGNLLKVAGYEVLEAKTRRYTRTGKGDNAFLRRGVEAFWRVAEKENRHPQTFVVARRPG